MASSLKPRLYEEEDRPVFLKQGDIFGDEAIYSPLVAKFPS